VHNCILTLRLPLAGLHIVSGHDMAYKIRNQNRVPNEPYYNCLPSLIRHL
jgi:hypothetical protein